MFSKAIQKASEENLKGEVALSYKKLKTEINKAKEKMLFDKKEEIVNLLSDEILKRYFYRDGMYSYQVVHNPEILKAVTVLRDDSLYNNILK